MAPPDNPVLLYITDPMCTWCYGFTPVVRRFRALWQGRVTVKPVMAGLNPFAEEPLTTFQKDELAVAWHRVQQRTGLPFDYRFFLRKDFVFNTEPPSRALLSVRLLRPALAFEMLRILLSEFHAGNQDITDTRVLVQIAGIFGIKENLFMTLFESEEIMRQLQEEFEFVQDLGVNNYPSVLLQQTTGYTTLAKGFCELPVLEERFMETLQTVQAR